MFWIGSHKKSYFSKFKLSNKSVFEITLKPNVMNNYKRLFCYKGTTILCIRLKEEEEEDDESTEVPKRKA